jgi:hypothetical protein
VLTLEHAVGVELNLPGWVFGMAAAGAEAIGRNASTGRTPSAVI